MEVLRTVEPPYAGYHALKRALARYRSIEIDAAIPGWSLTNTLKRLDTSVTVSKLRLRLIALGDLAIDVAPIVDEYGTEVYSVVIADGVKHFQMRHGLTPDCVLGRATQTALAVPISDRVRQTN